MALIALIVNFLFAVTAIWVIFYLYTRYNHTYWKRLGIPSLRTHWFYGNLEDGILFRKSPSVVVGELHLEAPESDVLGIYILQKPFLLVRNPELIKQILVKDFNVFPDRFFTAESRSDKIGSSNLFTIKNPEWRQLRTKITPVFTSGKMKKLFYLIIETADTMKNYLHDEFSDGTKTKTMLMKDVTMKYTTNIISSVAFGVCVNSFDTNNNEFFRRAQKGLRQTFFGGLQLSIMFFFPYISSFMGKKILGSATDYLRKVFWDSMDNREITKTKRGDLIDSLIELKNNKQENDYKLKGDVLVSQAAIFFIAGRESSVATMCFALFELARNPGLQKRARNEILQILETQELTYESIQNMKYVNQVISEILRMYPPAPILDRVATSNYKIPGTDMIIEKGTPIYVPLYGLHRDPKFYSTPDRFDPDRFSDENKGNIKQCTYMPFGEGPRICIGLRLGTMQSIMGVITVLKDYEVSLDPTFKYEIERSNVFLTVPDGFRLNLTKL
ncbi:PREDICTED: cytochrome P450 6k1-like [Dufourea novaeangliae]|uniref:cytochrome P450 6k1-like n=1 Tax=Dufourea novaeangliae TaxID=178035 RepID=UPI0007670342|nr:PREDICTED: cytochrome P450 6k1-like [Dufourea novaeangliae]